MHNHILPCDGPRQCGQNGEHVVEDRVKSAKGSRYNLRNTMF